MELLIQEHRGALDSLDDTVTPAEIYIAATRVVMRLVVVLFAEARDLLPRDNPLYHGSYGLQGLRESLERAGGGASEERLRHHSSAWPRILALFRLIHDGSAHPQLAVTRYGGGLFHPGNPQAKDAVLRALVAFESPEHGPSDAAVRRILDLLTRSRVRVRQGRGATYVETPVDFSDLSSEYIGILYEGLLDFELRRAAAGDPMLFLNLGDQPALPLSRLEAMDDKSLGRLMEAFKQKSGSAPAVEEEEAAEEEADAGQGEETEETAAELEPDPVAADEPPDDEPLDDLYHEAHTRAHAWARRAAVAGKLVAAKKGAKGAAAANTAHEAALDAAAQGLIARLILPGEWFLVRWGGTRKGAGTFYTRPQLAVPTVHRTLRPLAYDPPRAPDGTALEEASAAAWTPKPPEAILALTVCDLGMGSASFLVASLRFLTDALVESLHHYGRIEAHGDATLVTLATGDAGDGSLATDTLPAPPDAENFDALLHARLKRYVVERCLYGVDIDPLAVELARLSLWVETMDRTLPFGFIDHKLKLGNSLVGCWFDHFRDYPALAWERDGGDDGHTTGVHHPGKGAWTKAIKDFRTNRIKPELQRWIIEEVTGQQSLFAEGSSAETLHDDAVADLRHLHELPVQDVEERAELYRREIAENDAYRRLKAAFDLWCATWFWPADRLDTAPTPLNFRDPSPDSAALGERLAEEHRFFHWELEFPDVFDRPSAGFDAVVGNPPWEIQKPSSKEFFSNIDPLYRTYGKQEALREQQAYFAADAAVEQEWLRYNSRFRALSNWNKHAGRPFGDGQDGGGRFNLGTRSADQHESWRIRRGGRTGYADPAHPFRHQGSADINTYKMFLEQAHALLERGGQMGLIVPSGVYTDKGSTDLRTLLLEHCRWRWLFGFENREGIFDIHRSFKFAPLIVQKGGRTEAIRTAFMRRSLADWENAEAHAIPYAREQVERFSPRTRAILELSEKRDLEILEKIYANSVLLGDDGPDGWGIKYATEFHMTNDSKLFPPRPVWEAKGYRPDEYGRWLKGGWRPGRPPGERWEMEPGVVLSVDGDAHIRADDVEDVALPLYQGVMVGQFDPMRARWISGTGLNAKWEPLTWEEKRYEPQFLIGLSDRADSGKGIRDLKVGFRDIARTTDSRTMIACLIPDMPCGNKVPALATPDETRTAALQSVLNSWVFDWILRIRQGAASINYYIIDELPLPTVSSPLVQRLADFGSQLGMAHEVFAPFWLGRTDSGSTPPPLWKGAWALTCHERLRLRCIADALAAEAYGLDSGDLAWILRDCDLPTDVLARRARHIELDPKGFWRVDKSADPELRQTVLALAAFRDLTDLDGDPFLSCNGWGGWMLPETLRLSDLGLEQGNHARASQPVRSRMGGRFLHWQLEQTAEQSWAEFQLHAANLRRRGL
ncbi:MAG: Eco57I restriction-modification methylase domain-containing protein [Candidatus Nanopelagicales bacterium]